MLRRSTSTSPRMQSFRTSRASGSNSTTAMSAFTVANDVWGDDSPNVGASGAPGPFIAFYAMTGQTYPVPPLPEFDPLDIAYVGTVMLEVAGLPLSATQHERKRLMMDCGGRRTAKSWPSTGDLSIRVLYGPHKPLWRRGRASAYSASMQERSFKHVRFGSEAEAALRERLFCS